MIFFFFFSSRRRHTRCGRDWSSDVCSSDLARLHDVAHVCWQYVGLGPDLADAADAARSVRLIADAYGLADRSRLVETILWWQDRCWRGIEAAADAGEPAMARLRDLGAAREVRAAYRWTAAHRSMLERALAR